ncbi:hypothetical protein QWY81_09150 [Polaribacter undariae]|uniref:Uncharacterized protein n=2 Tax=Polaribacter sejongensis TaxID=985043 RepID=A0AAJ1VG99_9FLAO|nr:MULTISPECIES: hypothetical protein [Polaribacter]MDN3619618.1 hypothetical protein [Polaribacter undariae]UWD32268.1 hypothetical protein NQP51_01060 [Polaribacter undariae]
MKNLAPNINDRVQNLMVDVFESISASDKGTIEISELLDTRSIFELVFEIVKESGFYSQDENFNLIKALNIDTDEDSLEDALCASWVTMGTNLNTAKTQEEFNAKFALFVPIILKKMEAIKRIAG